MCDANMLLFCACFFGVLLQIKSDILTEKITCQDVFIINAADIAQPTALHNNLLINARSVPYGLPCSDRWWQNVTSNVSYSQLDDPFKQEIVLGASNQIHLKILPESGLMLQYSAHYDFDPTGAILCNFTGESLISNRHKQTVIVCSPYWTFATNCSCNVILSMRYFSPEQPCVELIISNQLRPIDTSQQARSNSTLIVQAFAAVDDAQCGPKNESQLIQYYLTHFTLKPGEYAVRKVNELKNVKFFYKDATQRDGLSFAHPCSVVRPRPFLTPERDDDIRQHFVTARNTNAINNFSPPSCPVTLDRHGIDFDPLNMECIRLLIGNRGPGNTHVMSVILPQSNMCYNVEQTESTENLSDAPSISGPLGYNHFISAEALVDQPVIVLFKRRGMTSTTCYESLDLEPYTSISRQNFVQVTCSHIKKDAFRCQCNMTFT